MSPSRRTPLPGEADPSLRPRDPISGEALPQTQQPGYYPGYSTLAQKAFWEETTRKLVVERVTQPPPRRFFTEQQWRFWETVFEHLIPQSDRTPDCRIPLIPGLDQRLHENRTVGYRFDTIAPDREVYTSLGIDAINGEAQVLFGGDFLHLGYLQQDRVIERIHDEKVKAVPDIWKKMAVDRFWQLITGDAVDAYYAHPWAWDEIGFGGPAYPRAYTRLERGEPEPWEVEEQRYEWLAPTSSVSDQVEHSQQPRRESAQHGPSAEENKG